MKKNILVYGILSGLVVSLVMAFSMIYMSRHPEVEGGTRAMIIGYLSMLIAFSLIFVSVKNFRDQQNLGIISFWQALKMGLLIALIGSTMYVITWALVFHSYMPDFMDKYAARAIENASKTATLAQLQQLTAEMNTQKEQYKNPIFFTLFTYMEILPVGILVSILAALILKRNKQKS